MMRNLEIERVVLAAMGVGIARRCLEVMNSYATDRKAFGSSLRDFGQVSGRTCGRRVGQVVQAASIETHH